MVTNFYTYPVEFRKDRNGTVVALVPDVPGTMTVGADREEALERVQGALLAMLAARMDDHEPIPRPSRPGRGQRVTTLPPVVAAKLSIYQTLRASQKSAEDLRMLLGWDKPRVRRVLDLRRRARFEDLEAVLKALGKRLVVAVENAA
jgi:antitoxin HicB